MNNCTFTEEQYAHIRQVGFKPGLCSECQEIDVVLKNLSTNANITSDLYEALNNMDTLFRMNMGTGEFVNRVRTLTQQALARVEGK